VYRSCLIGVVSLVVLSHVLTAQASGSIDVGTAVLDQPTIGSASVLTAAGALAYATARGELAANALVARTPNELYTGQAVATAVRYASPFQQLRWELAATASSFGVSGVAPSFGGQLLAREHLALGNGGAFAGLTGGTVGQESVWRRILGVHGGGFVRLPTRGRDELSAALAYTDARSPAGFGSPVRYADLFGYWEHRGGLMELLIGGGARSRASTSLGTAGWASGTATLWVMPRLAVVLSAGRALEDVARAVPSVRYVSLAVRVGQHRPTPNTVLGIPRTHLDHGDGHLDVRATDDSMRLVTVHADTAMTVDLMADFTDWEPVALTKMPNGSWTLERPIVPGVHHVAIRVDGGAWRAPPNLAHAPDEFGGEVGLLAVP
jgi:hypothetical protein